MSLRRSSRVRQSGKHASSYYDQHPNEKASGLFDTPHVRPRKWLTAQVQVGYFMVKRWVPKDQQQLTAELHGGLTDPTQIAAAKLALRANSKASSRYKVRSRMSGGARLVSARRSSISIGDNGSGSGPRPGQGRAGSGGGGGAGAGGAGSGSGANGRGSSPSPAPSLSSSPPPPASAASPPPPLPLPPTAGAPAAAGLAGGSGHAAPPSAGGGEASANAELGEGGDGSGKGVPGGGCGGGGEKRPASAMEPDPEDVVEPPLQSKRVCYAEETSREAPGSSESTESRPAGDKGPERSAPPSAGASQAVPGSDGAWPAQAQAQAKLQAQAQAKVQAQHGQHLENNGSSCSSNAGLLGVKVKHGVDAGAPTGASEVGARESDQRKEGILRA